MKRSEVKELVKVWQKRLGLSEWTITVDFDDIKFAYGNVGTLP